MPTAPSTGAWLTKPKSVRAVLVEVLRHGSLSRAEIASRLGLSKTTLTRIARDLVADGFLIEGETELRSSMGRPSELLELVAGARHFLGIKLTGDCLYAAVTDLSARVVASTEEPLRSTRFDDVVAQIAEVAGPYRSEYPRLAAVGLTLGGNIRRSSDGRSVASSEFLGWRDVPLSESVSTAVGLPTIAENDVQALAAAEHWFGAAAGLDSVALITIGVGVGCGLIINGELVEGAHGMPGRVAHLLVDQSGPVCEAGHRGCASSYLTNSAIARALGNEGSLEGGYQLALSRARAGDRAAQRVFDDAAFALGSIIGTVTNLLDPQKVILTGDGLALWEVASAGVMRGIQSSAGAGAETIDLDVQPFDFGEWARAGAALAIRMAAQDVVVTAPRMSAQHAALSRR